MTAWNRRSLAVLLLMLVGFSYWLNLVAVVSTRTDADVLLPFVLVEMIEEGDEEESGEFELLLDSKPNALAVAVTYAAHIAEECELDRALHRKSHWLRGPPAA